MCKMWDDINITRNFTEEKKPRQLAGEKNLPITEVISGEKASDLKL